MPGRSSRLYRWLLRFVPGEFRGDFGDEMSQVFADERADAASRGRLALAALWARTLSGLAALASREHLQILWRDAAYALRLMAANRMTTAATIVTLALGVGVSTAMFTVVKTVMLDLPIRDPERLMTVLVQKPPRGNSAGIAPSQYERWKSQRGSFVAIGALWGLSPVLTGTGEARRLGLECVSPNMFATLGVGAAIGRTFTDDEGLDGGPSVIVVSHPIWRRLFAADPSAIGRAVTLDGLPATVVGVMPAEFDGTRATRQRDGWLTLADCTRRSRREGRDLPFVNLYARLAPGASVKAAEAQLESTLEPPATPADALRVHLSPLTDQILGDVREPLLALQGAAACVLLIGCANIASLLLGRAESRRRELALRVALGCTRARMIRQLLTESLLFSLLAGGIGLLVTYASLEWLVSLIPGWVPRVERIAIDGRVLMACLGISLVAGALVGLLPAWLASRVPPGPTIKDSTYTAGPARRRARGLLIVAEIAISVALLAGGGLLFRTFMHLRPVDPGFDPRGKLAVTINLPRSRYADRQAWTAFLDRARARLRDLPGLQAVEVTSYLPLSGFVSQGDIEPAPGAPPRSVDMPIVTPGYFDQMAIRVVRGRGISVDDREGAADVAVVNETMARRLWPDRDPLGLTVKVNLLGRSSVKTIVGVARDTRSRGSRLTGDPEMFVPFAQNPASIQRFVLTTAQTADTLAPLVRAEMARMDPLLPIGDVEPVTEITTTRVMAQWRFATSLMGGFALMALALAAVGLFAIVAAWVTERTTEIGLRMALGAGPSRVLGFFLGRAAWLVGAGLAAGLALGALTTRFLATWLVDISPLDRTSFTAAAAIMAAVSLAGAYLAARRATRIDPLTALRSD